MPTEPLPPGVVWDPAPKPVPAQPGQRQGGVILTDPTVIAKEGRAEREEDRSDQSNVRQEENQAFGNEQALRTEFVKRPAVAEFQTVSRAYAGALKAAPNASGDQSLIVAYAKMLDPASVVREGEAASVAGGDSTIGRKIAQFKKEFGIESGGALSPEIRNKIRREMRNLTDQYGASYDQARSEFEGLAESYGFPPERVVGPHLMEPFRKDVESFWSRPENADLEVSGDAGSFATPEDKAHRDRLQQAWAAGATPEDIFRMVEEDGYRVTPEMRAALEGKEPGAPINFSVPESGNRDEATSVLGITPDSKVGAYTIAAANGLLSGGLDELAPILGLDAELVETAKQQLREKYPGSSFVGEVSGQAMQMAVGAKGLGALGASGKTAALASEVGGGAAYGAGESNDNRAFGAGMGAVAGLIGNRIGARLASPEAKSAIDKVAEESGVPAEEITRLLQNMSEQTESPPVSAAAQEEVAALAKSATGIGPSASSAKKKLAIMAKTNPEAAAAAERLGVDLPLDILSDNAQVQSLAGLARSQVGSEAETQWLGTSAKVAEQARVALADLGATTDLAQVSDDVLARLNTSMEALETQANTVRAEVTQAINVRDRLDATGLQGALGKMIEDYGGLSEAKQAFSSEEKKLLAMLGEGEVANRPTYALLNKTRDDIGDALFKGKGPWADTSQANLAIYYKALAEDQLAYVESVGGKVLADKMKVSNTLYSQMFDVRDTMKDTFGKQLEGSLTPLLKRAVTSGSKGDAKAINELLSKVPEDMQGPALLSSIMAQSQSSAAHGGFSFANYTKLYRGLRENGPVYSQIAKAIGPEGSQILTDLYAISRRMADGETKVLKTGKANQALAGAMQAESLIGGVLKATAKRGVTGASATAGAAVGGPAGAFAGASMAESTMSAISKAGKTRLDKAHDLLASTEFRGLVEKLSTGDDSVSAFNRLANSKAFNKYAAAVGLGNSEARKAWLTRLLSATATSAPPSLSNPASPVVIEQ